MSHSTRRHPPKILKQKYPPSAPCSCEVCLSFCARPGWWTVAEAAKVIGDGFASRIMLEISPEHTIAVLSPAFKGCDAFFAVNEFAHNGCTFLEDGLCQLYGTDLQPLECRFCHHDRIGLGSKCHADLEKDWDSPAGRALVIEWLKLTGLWNMRQQTRLKWLE